MAKRGKYQKSKKTGGAWKVWLITAMIVVILAVLGYVFRQNILDIVIDVLWDWKGSKINTVQMDDSSGSVNNDFDASQLVGVFEEPTAVTQPAEPAEEETTVPPTEAATEETEPDYGETGKIINVLLIGQDSRAGEESKLADTIMLLTLNKEKKTVTATSFPRDTYVNLPDMWGHECGWNRINTAYALGNGWKGTQGAMEMLNTTLQKNFGVNVQQDVEISFDAFYTVVNRLGFLQIELYGDELEYMNQCSSDMWWGTVFVEGENDLYDVAALEYVRMRHSNNADSDIKRQERQRMVIQQIVNKLKKMNPMELNALIDDVLGMVTTNISEDDMKLYIKECLPYLFEITVVSNQCPAPGSYWGEMKELPDGVGGVLRFDEQTNRRLMAEICEG